MSNKQILKSEMARWVAGFRPLPKRSLSVLTYHSIGSSAAGSLSRSRYIEHLETINKFPSLQFFDWSEKFTSSAEHACLVTFDDGYLDNFTEAAPLLDERGVKAIFFVTTGFLEGVADITQGFKNYRGLPAMSWDQVGTLMERGHTIGLHGHTHRDFGQMSDAQTSEELSISLDLYRRRLNATPDCFAYPFGQYQHRTRNFAKIANAVGLRFLFTTDNRLASLDSLVSDEKPVRVPRIRIDTQDDPTIVTQKLQGAWDYVAIVQRIRSGIAMRSLAPILQHDR